MHTLFFRSILGHLTHYFGIFLGVLSLTFFFPYGGISLFLLSFAALFLILLSSVLRAQQNNGNSERKYLLLFEVSSTLGITLLLSGFLHYFYHSNLASYLISGGIFIIFGVFILQIFPGITNIKILRYFLRLFLFSLLIFLGFQIFQSENTLPISQTQTLPIANMTLGLNGNKIAFLITTLLITSLLILLLFLFKKRFLGMNKDFSLNSPQKRIIIFFGVISLLFLFWFTTTSPHLLFLLFFCFFCFLCLLIWKKVSPKEFFFLSSPSKYWKYFLFFLGILLVGGTFLFLLSLLSPKEKGFEFNDFGDISDKNKEINLEGFPPENLEWIPPLSEKKDPPRENQEKNIGTGSLINPLKPPIQLTFPLVLGTHKINLNTLDGFPKSAFFTGASLDVYIIHTTLQSFQKYSLENTYGQFPSLEGKFQVPGKYAIYIFGEDIHKSKYSFARTFEISGDSQIKEYFPQQILAVPQGIVSQCTYFPKKILCTLPTQKGSPVILDKGVQIEFLRVQKDLTLERQFPLIRKGTIEISMNSFFLENEVGFLIFTSQGKQYLLRLSK